MTVFVNAPQWPTSALGEALMRDIGDLAIRLIRTRTQAGKDREGKPFVPYTPAYAEKKAQELGGGGVNLTVSGRMLNDMAITSVAPGKVSLGFKSSGGKAPRGKGQTLIQRSRAVGGQDKATYHTQLGAGKARTIRDFFGLTDAETNTIRERVERAVDTLARSFR